MVGYVFVLATRGEVGEHGGQRWMAAPMRIMADTEEWSESVANGCFKMST